MLKRRTVFCVAMAFALALTGGLGAQDTDLSVVVLDSGDPTIEPGSMVDFEVQISNAGPDAGLNDDSNYSVIDVYLPMGAPMDFLTFLQMDEAAQDAFREEFTVYVSEDDNIWDDDLSGFFFGVSSNNNCSGFMLQPSGLNLAAGVSDSLFYQTVVPEVGVAGVGYRTNGGDFVTVDYHSGGCGAIPPAVDVYPGCYSDILLPPDNVPIGVPCMGIPLTMVEGFDAPITLVDDGVSGPQNPLDAAGTPSDGCEDFEGLFPVGHIALIDRVRCSFQSKVENAVAAGASGVIIANEENGGANAGGNDEIGRMGCSTAGTCAQAFMPIPVISVSYNTGLALKAGIDGGGVTGTMGIRQEEPNYAVTDGMIWEIGTTTDTNPDNDEFYTATTFGEVVEPPDVCTPIYVAAAASFPTNSPPWASDLGINNNSDEALTYKFQFLPSNTDNTDVAFTEEFTLEANTNANYVDIWNTYAGEGAGSINVCVSNPDAAGVTSRIYTTNVLGTIGQGFVGIEGMTPEKLIGANERVRLGSLKQTGTKNQVTGFRTNVGFMNAGAETITVTADFYGNLGGWLGTRSVDLAPYSSTQWNDAYNGVSGVNNDVELGWIEVWSSTEGAMFLTYASVIDNKSNDPSTVWPFDTAQMVGGDELSCTPVWVAAAASFPNNDPVWASDLNLTNLGADALTYTFQFLPRGADNSAVAMSDPFTLQGNQAVEYSDIWSSMTGGQGSGAINVCVDNADNAGITSRIYSIASNGTYGQTFVGMRGSAPAKVATGEKVRLGYLFENDDFRTNIGFMNAGADAITVMVEFFDMDGTSLGTKGVNLAPYSNTQWNKAYTLDPIFASGITAGFADVWTDSADANFLTYASIVDNGTGDPSTIWPF